MNALSKNGFYWRNVTRFNYHPPATTLNNKAQFRKKTSRNLWKTIYQEKQQFSSAPYWNPIACFERFTKENEKENKKDERENFVHIDVGGADVGPDWCKAKANVGRW